MRQILTSEDFTLENSYYCSIPLKIEFNGFNTVIEVELTTSTEVILERSMDKINWYRHTHFNCNSKDIIQCDDLHPLIEYRLTSQTAFIKAVIVS